MEKVCRIVRLPSQQVNALSPRENTTTKDFLSTFCPFFVSSYSFAETLGLSLNRPDHIHPSMGVFLVTDNRVFKKATWSLATFIRLHCSFRSLALQHSALLPWLCLLFPFKGWLTHFAHSHVRLMKFLNMGVSSDDSVYSVDT